MTNMLTLINGRIEDLKAKKASFIKNEMGWKESTIRTQRHQVTRDIKTLVLIKELYKANPSVKLSEGSLDHLSHLVEPGMKSTIQVQAGDSLINILTKKYADVKDAYNKIMKAADKAGLMLNRDGIFEEV